VLDDDAMRERVALAGERVRAQNGLRAAADLIGSLA
jgi:hypothetical protein